MNKRMKKKVNTYRALTNKERIRNQRITIHKLFEDKSSLIEKVNHLETTIVAKADTINTLEKTTNSQMEIIEELNNARNSLKEQLAHKEDEIVKVSKSLELMYTEASKKIRDLEEALEFQKKDIIAANEAYEDTEKELQALLHTCEVERDRANKLLMDRNQAERNVEVYGKLYQDELASSAYWQKLYVDATKELDKQRAKPWWKKVLNIG